ncbi:MAG: hypothetical protein ABH846_00280 [Patescibacteria group bacterium]
MSTSSIFKSAILGVIIVAISAAAYFLIAPTNQAQALSSLSSIQPGDLFRGETHSAVYFMGTDGFRYVFPNQKTFDTWYEGDFSSVKFISDADLTKVQMGGNATYKPGYKMVKIQSNPDTYAVSKGGELRHVTSEAIAIDLYGSNWNTKIDDVPDGFFSNYYIGSAINSAGEFSVSGQLAAATSINADKSLVAPVNMSITDSGYSPVGLTVDVGEPVRFTNNGSQKHTATGDALDWGTGTLNAGESYIKTFDEAGVYSFFDSYDSANTGAIYVE